MDCDVADFERMRVNDGSWFGVSGGVGMAAGSFCGAPVHDFDAREIGVVDIDGVLAVAPYFGTIEFAGAAGAKNRGGGVSIVDAEREMILHAEFPMVGGGGDVEHEFDPVVAVGNLNLIPVDIFVGGDLGVDVLEAAIPIEAEAEKLDVELFHAVEVIDDEAGMNELVADAAGVRGEIGCGREFEEGEAISFRVLGFDVLKAVGGAREVRSFDAMGSEKLLHLGDVTHVKGHEIEEGAGGTGGRRGKLDVLVGIDSVTRSGEALAIARAGSEAEYLAIKRVRFSKIRGFEPYESNGKNFGACDGICGKRRQSCQASKESQQKTIHQGTLWNIQNLAAD